MTDDLQPDHGSPASDPSSETTATPIATAPVAMTPVGGTPRPSMRSNRLRWFAALAVVAVVVVASAAITLALTGASPKATILGYVPAASVMYGELRLDLPGDQRQKLGAFLSRFPGFADQAALESKLDEVLDRLVGTASDSKQTFTKDIKPWFGGELGFSMGPPPTASASTDPTAAIASTRALLLVSVTDEALARTWFTNTLNTAGIQGTSQDFNGTTITVFSDPKLPAAKAALAVVGGKVAIVGDLASVQAAISTNGASAFSTDAAFTSALTVTDSDHVGFVYLRFRALMERFSAMSSSLSGPSASPAISSALLDLVPEWTASSVRVVDDAILLDSAVPHTDATLGPTENRANGVAAYAPPSTIALLAGNDYGKTLLDTVALYKKDPASADAIKGVEDAAGVLGGIDAAVGWMGDSGVVIDKAADGVEGGIVVIPKDAAAAQKLLTTVRSFAALGGAQQGITVSDETYKGTTITSVDVGDPSRFVGLASGLTGMPTPEPSTPGAAGNTHVVIAFAATDGVVAVGSGADFVKHVLDAGSGTSLADDARFTSLVARAGAQHVSLSYVDLTAIRTMLEARLGDAPAADRTKYETEIKPFLVPFDAIVASNVRDGSLDRGHLIVSVK